MPCELCENALSEGQKFCSNCGAATAAVTIESLNLQIASLNSQVAELIQVRKGTEQRFLETDTAERVVARVMTWTKYFGFFVAIPATIIVTGIGIWAHKNFKDLYDVADSAKSSVGAILDSAKKEAGAAQVQASDALTTSKAVNQNIEDTQRRLSTLGATVTESSKRVAELNSGVDQQQSRLQRLTASTAAQSKAVETLNHAVEVLNKSRIEQDIGDIHPEFGVHRVMGQKGETLAVATKPSNTTYVAIDVFNQDRLRPTLTSAAIADGVATLQAHGFQTFFGPVALFATTGGQSTPITAFRTDACRTYGGFASSPNNIYGVPCIIYFRADMRTKALEARKLLNSVEQISDDRVKLVPLTSLDASLRELVESIRLTKRICKPSLGCDGLLSWQERLDCRFVVGVGRRLLGLQVRTERAV